MMRAPVAWVPGVHETTACFFLRMPFLFLNARRLLPCSYGACTRLQRGGMVVDRLSLAVMGLRRRCRGGGLKVPFFCILVVGSALPSPSEELDNPSCFPPAPRRERSQEGGFFTTTTAE